MKWDGFTIDIRIGLKNFQKIFGDKKFLESLGHTFYFAFFTVLFSMTAALALALLLNRKVKFVNFFRSSIFFPYVASVVAISCVWKAMFMENGGVINSALQMIGFAEDMLPGWIASTKWAMPAVIIVSVWRNMGYFMIIIWLHCRTFPLRCMRLPRLTVQANGSSLYALPSPCLHPATSLYL